ncbi:MAG: FAD-dependent oxidoreductase [Lentisphaeria bacterium]|nr:FAD-dependent oxidoreductase [Lentisphaeria bacterium]
MTDYDIIIAGAGPAGLTAAIYARRAGKSVLVLEKAAFGGQITHSPKVENYPGFPVISGNELAEKLLDQAIALGAEVDVDAVTDVVDLGEWKSVITERKEYITHAVIIASGSKHRTLGLPNEEELTGNGVSYCVLCDGAFFAGREVAVIGGGNSALQEAVLLSETCSKVTVIQNLGFLTGEESLIKNLQARQNVYFIFNTIVTGLQGKEELTGLKLKNTEDNTESDFAVDGIFVAIGQVPENKPFAGVCEIDERGYIVANETCCTKTPGIFVAGDCRTKGIRQITTATGDGASAALAACKYIEDTRVL